MLMYQLKIASPLAAAALGITLLFGAYANEGEVAIHIRGDQKTEFRWISDRCDDNDTPDAPVRAFRDHIGDVHLLASHFDNRPFIVINGRVKRGDCRSVLDSPGDPDPAKYRDRRWITATWTEDGRLIHALVHHEYQAQRHAG